MQTAESSSQDDVTPDYIRLLIKLKFWGASLFWKWRHNFIFIFPIPPDSEPLWKRYVSSFPQVLHFIFSILLVSFSAFPVPTHSDVNEFRREILPTVKP